MCLLLQRSASGKILTPRTNFLMVPSSSRADGQPPPPQKKGEITTISNLFVPRGFLRSFHLQVKNPVLLVASTGSFQRISRISVLKIHGDAAAHPAAERKQASKRQPSVFPNYHKHQPSPLVHSGTTGCSRSYSLLLHTVADSLGSVHQRSSHSWMGDPNFLPPAHRTPNLHQSQRCLSWSSLLTGGARCRSKLYSGEEGGGGG